MGGSTYLLLGTFQYKFMNVTNSVDMISDVLKKKYILVSADGNNSNNYYYNLYIFFDSYLIYSFSFW